MLECIENWEADWSNLKRRCRYLGYVFKLYIESIRRRPTELTHSGRECLEDQKAQWKWPLMCARPISLKKLQNCCLDGSFPPCRFPCFSSLAWIRFWNQNVNQIALLFFILATPNSSYVIFDNITYTCD